MLLPAVPDPDTVDYIAAAAHALGYVVIVNRRFTDLFEWGQRSAPFSLAAEIQRRLLPASLTCEAGQFTVAGAVEPAGNVGGDTFDYSLDRDTLHVSLTDAMGHEEDAALLATLLVGSLRNSRRSGATLAEQAARANAALLEHGRPDQFVTGQLLRVDLTTGTGAMVNAGHPGPLRVRDGRVEDIELAADPPFGIVPGIGYRVQPVALLPGDRFVIVTDGVLERNAATADVFGLLAATGDLHPREVVQEITRAVLRAVGGNAPGRRHRAVSRLVRRRRTGPAGRRRREPSPHLPTSTRFLTKLPHGAQSQPHHRTPTSCPVVNVSALFWRGIRACCSALSGSIASLRSGSLGRWMRRRRRSWWSRWRRAAGSRCSSRWTARVPPERAPWRLRSDGGLAASVVASDEFYRDMPAERRWTLTAAEGVDQYFDWQRLRREVLEPLRAPDLPLDTTHLTGAPGPASPTAW